MPVMTVKSPGTHRVKPSDHFIPKANAISKIPAMPSSTQDMGGISGFRSRGRRRAECYSKPVESIHQANRVCQFGEFLVTELRGHRNIFGIRNTGLSHPCHSFRPAKRAAFAGAEYRPRLTPHRNQHQLVDRKTGLEQIARMHIDAIGTPVDLRNPQIDEINQRFWQIALLQRDIYTAKSLVTFWRSLGVVDAITHDKSSLV